MLVYNKVFIMKKYIYLLITIAFLYACSEEELQKYESGNYLNFQYQEYKNFKNDSVDISFFFYPGKDKIKVPIGFELVGNLLNEDKEFVLEFDKENSTAEESDFSFEEKLMFKANKTIDTVFLTLNKSEKLNDSIFKIVFNLVENSNFKPGITEKKSLKIYFTSQVSKPEWWKDDIETVYLGEFSAEKYNLFFQLNNITDLEDVHLSIVRQYALKLKHYLFENPTYDSEGNLLTVPVIG